MAAVASPLPGTKTPGQVWWEQTAFYKAHHAEGVWELWGSVDMAIPMFIPLRAWCEAQAKAHVDPTTATTIPVATGPGLGSSIGDALGSFFGPAFSAVGTFIVNAGLVTGGIVLILGGLFLAVDLMKHAAESTTIAGSIDKARTFMNVRSMARKVA